MPASTTYTTVPPFVPNGVGGNEPDRKGIILADGDTVSGPEGGPITFKTSASNRAILEANGYEE